MTSKIEELASAIGAGEAALVLADERDGTSICVASEPTIRATAVALAESAQIPTDDTRTLRAVWVVTPTDVTHYLTACGCSYLDAVVSKPINVLAGSETA